MLSLWLLWLSHLILDMFTGIWPIYKTMCGLSLFHAGLIIGISGFAGELSQVFFGYIADKGKRTYIVTLGLILASCMVWITHVEGIYIYFILLLLLMIGSGAYHPAAAGMAALLSEKRKSACILFYASGGAVGLGISQLIFINVFKNCAGSILLLSLPVIGVIFLFLRHKFPERCTQQRNFSTRAVFRTFWEHKRSLGLLYTAQVLVQTVWLATVFFLPDLMREKQCAPWLQQGGGHLCFILGSAAMMIPAGHLCDRLGEKKVLLGALVGGLSFFYLLLSQASLHPVFGGILLTLLGAFLGVINPTILSWGNRIAPENPSSVSALLMGCAWCVGNLGPLWGGWISSSLGPNSITITLALMGTLLILILPTLLALSSQKQAPTPA